MKNISIYKKEIIIGVIGIFAVIISALPFFSTLTYAIDDYYLWNVYEINWDTMGYNFYSTGRVIEGIIAEIFYRFNLQPLNGTVGMLVFGVSIVVFGIYISHILKIDELEWRIAICLLFVLNPFFTEIYYYRTITVYCGFAVIFLMLGFIFSNQAINKKKVKYLMLALLFYCLSLGVYQIFYPIIGFLLVIMLIRGVFLNKVSWKNWFFLLGIYIISFVLFYIILKIMFFISPPTLVYDGTDIALFLKSLFSSEYWVKLINIAKIYFGNNIFNSKIIFLGINAFTGIVLLVFLFLKRNLKALLSVIIAAAYMLVGPFICFGFGLARLNNVSGRTLTSFGIYEVGIIAILYFIAKLVNKERISSFINKMVPMICLIVALANGCIQGRAANNIIRLNNTEENMVNRVVYRLEEFPEFTGTEALAIYGVPSLGNVSENGLGDFGTPASVNFSKVLLFNEVSGYCFEMPNSEQSRIAEELILGMETWPAENAVMYCDGMFVVRLYY